MQKLNSTDTQFEKISLRNILLDFFRLLTPLKKKWKLIIGFSILGGFIGFAYAFLYPVKYVSKTSFVVEESKSGLGGISALAGQFGFDLGGNSGGGFFSGDNVTLFLKSEGLCREVLMTNYDETAKTLADVYIETAGLKKTWKNNSKIGEISFAKYVNKSLPRKEDSLLQYIIRKRILKNELSVDRADKKSSFIFVQAAMRDEKLSYLFNERLINIASKKYVQSKLKFKLQNLQNLQKRADSLQYILNSRTSMAASTQQNFIDGNPGLKINLTSVEISNREKTMVGTIFAEVVKNLEISKTLLSQETPVVEIIDKSTFPLFQDKKSKAGAAILFAFIFGFVISIYLILKNWLMGFSNKH